MLGHNSFEIKFNISIFRNNQGKKYSFKFEIRKVRRETT